MPEVVHIAAFKKLEVVHIAAFKKLVMFSILNEGSSWVTQRVRMKGVGSTYTSWMLVVGGADGISKNRGRTDVVRNRGRTSHRANIADLSHE